MKEFNDKTENDEQNNNKAEKNDNTETKDTNINDKDNSQKDEEKKDNNGKNNSPEYKKIKLSFFKKIKVSIIDFDKYYIIASESVSRTIGYLVKLFILFSVIVSIAVTYKVADTIKDVCNNIEKDVPSFKLTDNTFSVDSEEIIRIEKNDGYINLKVIMDNSDEYEQYKQELETYNGYAIALNKHNFTAKISGGNVVSFSYEEIKDNFANDISITKESIINILTDTNVYILVFAYIVIVLFLIYFVSMLIDIFALSLLGLIITKIVRLPLTYSSVLAIAASSTTLPIILNLLYLLANVLMNFTMPQFQTMITLVSYIYLIAGILILRSNLIKNSNNTIKPFAKDNNEEEKGT